MAPGSEIWRQELSKLPHPFPELAEKYYIAKSYDELDNITKYDLLEKESYFYCIYYIQVEFTFRNIIILHEQDRKSYRSAKLIQAFKILEFKMMLKLKIHWLYFLKFISLLTVFIT